ncbi:hypothetical protein IPA_08505 [Ignicoccus pacificus DSM 13166]|uniref:Uncharacterized protein n=1 Tax=Ignicoccus pacificus DSM 13166 TaxID=940294 RepID=A0A977KA16_9CREN|nr:hypothetical protein IPA_08505 [Ignicoccus pacificus DSM 13166]
MVYVTQRTDLIISLLKEKGSLTSKEIITHLIEKGVDVIEARVSLANLVREGAIEKVPDYEKKVEVFKLKE